MLWSENSTIYETLQQTVSTNHAVNTSRVFYADTLIKVHTSRQVCYLQVLLLRCAVERNIRIRRFEQRFVEVWR
ncbi:hypothetical protein LSAT2_017805 [Lamellibrachia satsuma]|nr:hypothetical protein LSAT2_017805 [Lamellibrachia satsuma]